MIFKGEPKRREEEHAQGHHRVRQPTLPLWPQGTDIIPSTRSRCFLMLGPSAGAECTSASLMPPAMAWAIRQARGMGGDDVPRCLDGRCTPLTLGVCGVKQSPLRMGIVHI